MISQNYQNIVQKINTITNDSGLKPKIIAVSKNQPLSKILEAIDAGITCFGENYIKEAKEKFEKVPKETQKKIEKHFIGHLQTNKAKDAVKLFDVIQTVDSVKLAKELSKQAQKIDKKELNILLQVNISNDPDKYGFKESEIKQALTEISNLPNIKIIGLMTILKFDLNAAEIHREYKKMKNLFDSLKNLPNIDLKYLSMGMSNDFKIAIEEGSNMVRIGTKIFGKRAS